jgi:hypothetical protein
MQLYPVYRYTGLNSRERLLETIQTKTGGTMLKNLLFALIIILPVTLISGGLTYWRAEPLTQEKTGEASPKQAEMSAATLTRAAVAFSVLFGLIVAALYIWMAGLWPNAAFNVFLGLAIVLTILFNVAAVVIRTTEQMSGVPECIALNTLFGIGYGWLLPLLIGRLG